MEPYAGYIGGAIVCAIISGKWAMELGFSQFRQLLWIIAGLLFPPLVLLVLYVRMLHVRGRVGHLGGAWQASRFGEQSA
jgi:hypothetical protein